MPEMRGEIPGKFIVSFTAGSEIYETNCNIKKVTKRCGLQSAECGVNRSQENEFTKQKIYVKKSRKKQAFGARKKKDLRNKL
jgi:hypothetical protein